MCWNKLAQIFWPLTLYISPSSSSACEHNCSISPCQLHQYLHFKKFSWRRSPEWGRIPCQNQVKPQNTNVGWMMIHDDSFELHPSVYRVFLTSLYMAARQLALLSNSQTFYSLVKILLTFTSIWPRTVQRRAINWPTVFFVWYLNIILEDKSEIRQKNICFKNIFNIT